MRTRSIQLSLKHLRKAGWQVAIVEKWLKAPGMKFGKRIDVWGAGDLLACRRTWNLFTEGPLTYRKETSEIALIQTTALSKRQRHIDKINAIPELEFWKKCGGLVILHSWRKLKPHGKRATWEVKEEFL